MDEWGSLGNNGCLNAFRVGVDLQAGGLVIWGTPQSPTPTYVSSFLSFLLQNFDSVPYQSASGPPQPAPHKMPGPYKPGSFAPKNSPYGPSPQPATSTASSGLSPQYGAGYPRAPPGHKPYPQPMPASYTTSAGPAFNVQVKVAQPVLGYGQPRHRAEQAYAPPSPRVGRGAQYALEPGARGEEGWYLEPGGYGKRPGKGECYGAGGLAKPGEAAGGPYQAAARTPGKEETAVMGKAPPGGGGGYQHQVM